MLRSKFFFIICLFFLVMSSTIAIRSFPNDFNDIKTDKDDISLRFLEAPEYKNGKECASIDRSNLMLSDNISVVHIAMTLDPEYLRGTIAAIHSVIKHASCPENIFFHLIASSCGKISPEKLNLIVTSAFPSLSFKVYVFDVNLVNGLISSSIRQALDNPLNYARSYLADILENSIKRVIYLDSDVIVVDDVQKLWSVELIESRIIGAPEYCHANFTKYFTDEFWFDRDLSSVFDGKTACYFNTGVMVMDLERWRQGEYTKEIEKWMIIQKERRIYELGSLPPFLLVFGGNIESIDHRWNQHGLGGDNVISSCRSLHPGPVSLLHWSGKGKPWRRLDEGKPCPIDSIWVPYDLYKHHHHQKGRQF